MTIRTKCRRRSLPLHRCPITFHRKPIVSKDSLVVTFGSCFALELKKWLKRKGYRVGSTGDDYELIWYNTRTILYEFERVARRWEQSRDDVWELPDGRWQDPYRRCVFAESKASLWEKIKRLDDAMRTDILAADVVVITLGLTEVFSLEGRVICACPGYAGGGGQEYRFGQSSTAYNLENMIRSVELLHDHNPKAELVLTVSPVPMFATFRDMDQAVANMASKSILRAVADEVCRRFDHVHYFHSYEMATLSPSDDVYKADGRHVKPTFVDRIMTEFEKEFVE